MHKLIIISLDSQEAAWQKVLCMMVLYGCMYVSEAFGWIMWGSTKLMLSFLPTKHPQFSLVSGVGYFVVSLTPFQLSKSMWYMHRCSCLNVKSCWTVNLDLIMVRHPLSCDIRLFDKPTLPQSTFPRHLFNFQGELSFLLFAVLWRVKEYFGMIFEN